MDNHFGRRLYALRKKSHKSQKQVVDDLLTLFPDMKMSQGTLSALENRASAPRGEIITMLCEYFSVPMAYFFGEHSTPAVTSEPMCRSDKEEFRFLYDAYHDAMRQLPRLIRIYGQDNPDVQTIIHIGIALDELLGETS